MGNNKHKRERRRSSNRGRKKRRIISDGNIASKTRDQLSTQSLSHDTSCIIDDIERKISNSESSARKRVFSFGEIVVPYRTVSETEYHGLIQRC